MKGGGNYSTQFCIALMHLSNLQSIWHLDLALQCRSSTDQLEGFLLLGRRASCLSGEGFEAGGESTEREAVRLRAWARTEWELGGRNSNEKQLDGSELCSRKNRQTCQ